MIFRLLIILFSAAVLCGCNGGSEGGGNAPVGEVSIAYLKSLCSGSHYRITNDYTLRGVVVANDWLGEFVKSVVVVDRSGGIEIAIESSNLAMELPVHSEIEIFCNGLMLARIGGKVELGAPSTGDFPIANIDKELLDRYIRVVGICDNFKVATKRISEVSAADIGAIIRFEKIRICDEERGVLWCDRVDGSLVTTYRTFVDAEGDSLVVRTLPTCLYATDKIPTNEISVAGVIDFSDNRYFVRIANGFTIE